MFDERRAKLSIESAFPGVWVQAKLGEGTFGIVHKAQLNLGSGPETVAIKSYDLKRIKNTMQPVALKLLLQKIDDEIQSLETLKSAVVLKIYKVVDDNLYEMKHLVIDHCDGGDLEQALFKNKGGFPEPTVKEWFEQLLVGLQELEEAGILHRDIKPANLLFKNSRIILADFGVSKFGSAGLAFTRVGSPIFCAPEIETKEGHNSKADVWSLGVTLYMLLFGRDPWNKYDGIQRKWFVTGQINDMRTYSGKNLLFPDFPGISNQLKEIIQRMLVWEQNDRISWLDICLHPYFAGKNLAKMTKKVHSIGVPNPPVQPVPKVIQLVNPSLNQVQAPGNKTVVIASGVQVQADPIVTATNYFIYLNNCAKFLMNSANALLYVASKQEIYHDGIWKDFGFLAAVMNKINFELVQLAIDQLQNRSQPNGIATSFSPFYNGPTTNDLYLKFNQHLKEVRSLLEKSITWMQTKYDGADKVTILAALNSPGFTTSDIAIRQVNKVAHALSVHAANLNRLGTLRNDTFLQVKQGLGRVYLCLTYQQAMEFRDAQTKELFNWKEFVVKLNEPSKIDEVFKTASDSFAQNRF